MNRIFVKLFLAFGLTTLLTGSLFVGVSRTLRQDPLVTRWFALHGSDSFIPLLGYSAAQAYESGGPEALARYEAEAGQSARLRLVLLDAEGTPLDQSGNIANNGARRGRIAPIHVSGPSGRDYRLVVEDAYSRTLQRLAVPALRMLLGFLAALAVWYGMARVVTRPIVALRNATRRLAEGDLSARSHAAGGDEIGELARDFDHMAERLEASITAQRRLLGDISHELRSPLARLSVAVALARQKTTGETNTSQVFDRIEREAERMNDLIGEILALTRLEEAGTRSSSSSGGPVDLSALVQAVAADGDYEARARGCRVTTQEIVEGVLLPHGEAELLQRAVENVVRNAVRYTAEGSTVTVALHKSAGSAIITVRDAGPGVPEASLSELFQAFYRVEGDRDRATGGVGLGLAIAERAVRLHGGTVYAENVSEGGGLLVTIRLPLLSAQ